MSDSQQDDTIVFFNDGTHPEYGRILQGKAFEVPSQTGLQRLNITGTVNAEHPEELYAIAADKVNAQSTIALWEGKRMIHAAYYRNKLVKEWLRTHPHVQVIYLPAYSPNLNPIERVWKLLKKEKNQFVLVQVF